MPPQDRTAQALRQIRNFIVHSGRAPSVRELAAAMGYKSPRSASLLIDDLVRAGFLAKRSGGRISLRKDAPDPSTPTVDVPILGAAPCGAPFFAEENVEGHVRVDTRLASPPSRYFILRAQGDSMNEAGIQNGDLVLVRSTPAAHDGDRVVALVDGEVTIKALRLGDGVVALEPKSTNKEHRPIYASVDLVIQGVVKTRLPRV